MNERVQRVLDGELPRHSLNAADLAALESAEQGLGQVLRAIPVQPLPDLAPAVMRRIAAAEAERSGPAHPATTRRPWDIARWLWAPRPVTLRPAYGLAAAALLAGVLLTRLAPPDPGSIAAPAMVLVHFQFEAPGASDVRLAGDFTEWQPTHVLSRNESGTWSIVVPLTPGVHEYAFVVDGKEWTPDPRAPAVADGFGGVNSRVAVLAADLGAS